MRRETRRALRRVRRSPRRLTKSLRQRVERGVEKPDRSRLAVITGCQSSGTTLVLRLVGESLATRTYNEDHPLAFRDLRLKEGADLKRLIRWAPCPWVVVKSPCDAHKLGRLLDADDAARGIWVFRGYAEVGMSWCRRWPGHATGFVSCLLADPDWDHWIAGGASPYAVERISSVWDPRLDDFAAASLIWWARNATYFEQDLDRRADVLPMEYERLLESPRSELGRLSEFLNVQIPKSAEGLIRQGGSEQPEYSLPDEITAMCEGMLERLRASAE